MDIESAPVTKRQTFSGYKKRKRLPPNSVTFTDISESEFLIGIFFNFFFFSILII